MKTTRQNIAFTLIEMLVVMVIMAILAGLLLPAVQLAKKQAKQAQARESIHQMATACRAYFVEFGRWPTPSASYGSPPTGSTDFYVATNFFGNRSGITFYDYAAKDVAATQVISGVTYTNLIVDPWKQAYRVRLDTSYTGSVTDPLDDSTVLQWGFAIWSLGPDGLSDLSGAGSQLNKDNPRSW